MKNILILTIVAFIGLNVSAQTNSALSLVDTNKAGGWLSSMPKEVTLGGSGITNPKTGDTEFGFDFSLSIQPLKQPIWFGISQGFVWEPAFSGNTDLYADWSWRIYKEQLYLNTGWSIGALYDRSTLGWRSGPELSLEYYTSGNAFIFAGLNYDLFTKDSDGWHSHEASGLNNLRYSFGIGFTW